MNNLLKKLNIIPVAIRVLILIVSSIVLGYSLYWEHTNKSDIEPKITVFVSLSVILTLGLDIYSQINNINTTQKPTTNTHTNTQTHSGKGDMITGDKIRGDKVKGNKIVK